MPGNLSKDVLLDELLPELLEDVLVVVKAVEPEPAFNPDAAKSDFIIVNCTDCTAANKNNTTIAITIIVFLSILKKPNIRTLYS